MSAEPAEGSVPPSPRQRRAVAAGALVAVAWPFVLAGPAAWRTASQVLALVLIGLSLTVTVGWLRVITLFAPAAAVAGAGATVVLAARDHPLLALVAASGAGAVTGLLALAPAFGNPRRWLPVTSLVVTVAGVLVMPRLLRPVTPPTLLRLDLADDRVLYLTGLAVVAAACAALVRLRRSPAGARLAAVGAGGDGVGPRQWVAGVALSGALAGAAGYLTSLLHHGVPSPMEFAPTTAVVYLAIPFVGGASSVGGALLGAIVFLAAARVSLAANVASVTLPAVLLVVGAATTRDGGLMAWLAGRLADRR